MVISSLILKLATRCNIACKYCYWFRDPNVYRVPKILTPDAENALIDKLEQHIRVHNLQRFSISLHGGEPLLFGKKRLADLCQKFVLLSEKTNCKIPLSLMTNGLLLDDEWINLLKSFQVNIALSIDGDPINHDANRIDIKGEGTYQRVENKLKLLQRHQINPPVLMVANPRQSAEIAVKHLVEKLAIKHFNVLIPDLTHEDTVVSIADYYCELFDLWFDHYVHKNIEIPIVEALIKVSLGGSASTQMVGLSKTGIVTMLTDGTLQASDDIRSATGVMNSTMNIISHQLQDMLDDPLWQEIYHFSDHLNKKCQTCQYKKACGGSTIVSRWSEKNRFDNPSVYCDDLQMIFRHVQKRLVIYSPALESQIRDSQTV